MTDAEFYFHSKVRDDYYDMFFENCRRFHVYWPTATEKEKAFVEEVTRVSFERKKLWKMVWTFRLLEIRLNELVGNIASLTTSTAVYGTW